MIVVDASVAVKWFLNETHSKEAISLLEMDEKLIGPTLARYEVASAFVRAYRRGEIDAKELDAYCSRWIATLDRNVLRLAHDPQDILRASSLAVSIEHPLADCVYLAMAERLNAPFVTADKVFIDKCRAQFPFVNFVADVAHNLRMAG